MLQIEAPATNRPELVEWLVLPDEQQKTYTNFEDMRPGDASELVARVNADPALNQGHADWRLPTIDELKTLIRSSEAPKNGWYWSASPYVGNASGAWGVIFGNGYVSDYYRSGYGHVRLVRASQ
jgi:hypothetical protein